MRFKRNAKFRTDDQLSEVERKARYLLREAHSAALAITEALRCSPEWIANRQGLHERLDMCLTRIERLRDEALKLDPEANEKTCVSSTTVRL